MALLPIKVVPKASVDRVVGPYGDAIKVQVSAPAEGGKANRAVLDLLPAALGVKSHQLVLVKGHTQSRKLVRIDGMEQSDVERRLGASLSRGAAPGSPAPTE